MNVYRIILIFIYGFLIAYILGHIPQDVALPFVISQFTALSLYVNKGKE